MAIDDAFSSTSAISASPQRTPAYALPAGYRLQEYSFERVLGHGGFGVTYLAADTNLHCRVAIKEYLPADQALRTAELSLAPRSEDAAASFSWGLARFIEEARALASFNHPHIVRVLRYFEANATAYMVMELVEGLPLNEWVKPRRPLSEIALLRVVAPLLDGLALIHAGGFVHRDIKPGNIHMRADDHPVLLDFGAARNVVTRAGDEMTAIVTPGYAAFEQYHSRGNQGPWTDIYSLAAVMYGIVCGERPIEAPARVRNDPLPKAIDVADRTLYSKALLQTIDWGLAPAEESRPQSVQEFMQALPLDALPARRSAPSRAPAQPEPAAPELDAASVTRLESALARHLGPLAAVLVKRQGKLNRSLASLRAALADSIDSESSRRMFLEQTEAVLRSEPSSRPPVSRPATGKPATVPGAASAAFSAPASAPPVSAPPADTSPPPVFDAGFLAAVEAELANHIGPLARVLVSKSAARARDRAELFLLLSDHIADAEQRRAFIRKSVAAFKDGR